jgi:hypothetical protein
VCARLCEAAPVSLHIKEFQPKLALDGVMNVCAEDESRREESLLICANIFRSRQDGGVRREEDVRAKRA